MTPPNQLPWTQHQPDALPSRQALYENEPLGYSARNNAPWCQEFGGGSASFMPLNSTRPNSEFNAFPGEFRPWPAGHTWIATDGNQVTTNDSMARDGGSSHGAMPPVNFEGPSREIYPMPTYPAGIAAELSAVIPQGFVTRGSGNSILWNEGGPSVQLESPLSECRPPPTSAPLHGPMDPVGYNLPPFAPSSNQGQIPQPAQGVNLNAMVVRPKISTPASALEAERRRVHPSKFSCDYCPDKFTSKANRNRHHSAHLGVKPYPCSCGKSFTAKADLRRHHKGRMCPF